MPISTLGSRAALLFGIVGLLPVVLPGGSQVPKQNTKPTVLQVDKTTRGVEYKVDSKPTGSTPSTDLLHVLNRVNDERGAGAPVVVLIDPRVPVSEIWNVDGVAGKAQLTNLRYFVFNRETERMTEITWGPSIPLSTNPRVN